MKKFCFSVIPTTVVICYKLITSAEISRKVTRQYLNQPPTFWLKTIKLLTKSVLWKPSPGSPNQLPWSHLHIHHRQNHCLHKQEEASYSDIPHQHKVKAFLFQNYPCLPSWHTGARCCLYKNSLQVALICTWVLVLCRSASKSRNRNRTFLPCTLLYYILLTLEFPSKEHLYQFIYTISQSKVFYFHVSKKSWIRSLKVIQYTYPAN